MTLEEHSMLAKVNAWIDITTDKHPVCLSEVTLSRYELGEIRLAEEMTGVSPEIFLTTLDFTREALVKVGAAINGNTNPEVFQVTITDEAASCLDESVQHWLKNRFFPAHCTPNFNRQHPELKDGEVYLINSMTGRMQPFESKFPSARLGRQAYSRDGTALSKGYPVFVSSIEYSAFQHRINEAKKRRN